MARFSRKFWIEQGNKENSILKKELYRVALYVRLSKEDLTLQDGGTVEMQKEFLKEYVFSQSNMELVSTYCDNGVTGTHFDRPEFERMMADIRSRKINCVVVKDLSRFGRNYVEAGYYLEKIFPFLNVRFIAINDHFDTLTYHDGDELSISLKNIVNAIYAKDISNKIDSALSIKRKKGEYVGNFAPYGYLKSPENKYKLVVDEEVAPNIRKIFNWKLQGMGNRKIARRLNEEGILSPSKYGYQKGKFRKQPSEKSLLWKSSKIKEIVENPIYAGHMSQGKQKQSLCTGMSMQKLPKHCWTIVYNTHEPIVDQETFDKVQKIILKRLEVYNEVQGKYRTTENEISDLILCGDCGKKMIRQKDVSKTGKIRYTFDCPNYIENRYLSSCSHKNIGESELFCCIQKSLENEIFMFLSIAKWNQKWIHLTNTSQLKEIKEQIKKYEKEITRNQTLRDSLFELYQERALTKTEYLAKKKNYENILNELNEKKREYLQKQQYHLTRRVETLWDSENTKKFSYKLLRIFIDHIEIKNYNDVMIVWKYKDNISDFILQK